MTPIRVLTAVLILVAVIQHCQSYYQHTQNVFCDSNVDFVIKGKVKKIIHKPNQIRYKVKIQAVFKSSAAYLALPNTAVGNKKKLRTDKPGGSVGPCTVDNLIQGNMYVITGKVIGTKLWISKCDDWIQDWTTLYTEEIQNLNVNYVPNCVCTVQTITGAPPPTEPPATACIQMSQPCGRYTFCQCNDVGCTSCSLAPSASYTTCAANVIPPP